MPTVSCEKESGAAPVFGIRPSVGLRPVTPQSAAGIRIDPPASVPIANGTAPDATAAAAPPEEPPAIRARSQGFRTSPKSGLTPVAA